MEVILEYDARGDVCNRNLRRFAIAFFLGGLSACDMDNHLQWSFRPFGPKSDKISKRVLGASRRWGPKVRKESTTG